MAAHDVPERYGVRPARILRHYYIPLAGRPPLTDEQIRENRANERNAQLQEEYNALCQRLVNALDDKIFLADSLGFVASLVTGGSLPIPCQSLHNKYEEATGELPLPEKNRNMRIRLTDVLLTLSADIQTLNTLNKFLLGRSCEHSIRPEPNTPRILYRAIRSSSYSRYDKHLGFRSSRQPLTLPSNHDGSLHESSLVDKDALKNHCEGGRPSDLIALSDSPVRILRLTKHWDSRDPKGDMIAVINVSKLLTMGVLFGRTTTLTDKLGMNAWSPSLTKGLRWVNPNYWVAYRWVPAECIEFCMSVEFLRSVCKEP